MNEAKKDVETRWGKKLWQMSVDKWTKRKQDLNYRDLLVWPGLEKVLSEIDPCTNGLFVDFGCGDGTETFKLRKLLESKGFTGTLLGIDQQQRFIDHARSHSSPEGAIRLFFEKISAEKPGAIVGNIKADLVVSQFVLQEVIDIEEVLLITRNLLKKEGMGIFVFVHPDFGEIMKEKHALKNVHFSTGNKRWIWSADYPIVEAEETFYVPYIQHPLDSYKKSFAQLFGRQQYIELMPDKQLVEFCEEKKLLPFCKHTNNVYYPEIVNMPSSVVVAVSN